MGVRREILLSICIPTYNRDKYLKICLSHIVGQFKSKNIYDEVEIVVSDNNSADNTKFVVQQYQKKFKNIRYFKNPKNIGGDLNIIKAASHAKGDYIWFFADDDIQYQEALTSVLDVIKKHTPDVILANLNLLSKNGKKIMSKNLFRLDTDIFVKTKKELFSFLETKFFLPVDWYTTCMSCMIISKKIFRKNLPVVMKSYNPSKNAFLHAGMIYYNPEDYLVYIISKPLVKYRAENRRMLGPDEADNRIKYYMMILNVFGEHNKTICKINKKNISLKFKSLLYLKDLSRYVRIMFLRYFHVDISNALIQLFERQMK